MWILDNQKPGARKGKIQLIDGSAMFRKMRKSLGNKRKELGDDDIARIVQLYGEFAGNDPETLPEDGEVSKVFKGEDFGYRTITVERHLKLNFAATPERTAAVLAEKAVAKLPQADRDKITAALTSIDPAQVWKNRPEFRKQLVKALNNNQYVAPAPAMKTLLAGLSEQDDTADTCTDSKGKPEPDTDLRDTENVPLTEDIDEYFQREVLPHVPDAWIDHSKTKIGYEIPFTRHFYKYVPPRSLEEIDADLNSLINDIVGLLQEVEA